MKKIVSILAIAITVPAFATDITGSSDCDNTTLGTYSAPVDMEAKWTANTINLQWYDDANDSTPVGTTCQYSSTIVLPTEPSKPGYNFAGWQLRQFDMSTLAEYINMDGNIRTSKDLYGNNCYYHNELNDDEVYSETCSESMFATLNNGEWSVTFDYGTVKGETKCENMNCFCHINGFMKPNGNTYMNVSSTPWAFVFSHGGENQCITTCVALCVGDVKNNANFRQWIYGITDEAFVPDHSSAAD